MAKTKKSSAKLSIESLLRNAFARARDSFLSYLLSMVIAVATFIAITIAFFILAGVLAFLVSIAHFSFSSGIVVGVAAFVYLVIMFYLFTWWHLAITYIIVTDSKKEALDAFKKVKPLVPGFVGVQALFLLLLFGLTPFSILTLGIIPLLWIIWSIFNAMAYLEKQRKGLDTLWYSRSVVNQQFWPIAGRMFLVFGILILLQSILNAEVNGLLHLLSAIISLFSAPFIISYVYEIYKQLPHPTKGERSTPWILASIIGGIILVVGSVLLGNFLVTQVPKFMKQNHITPQFIQQEMQQYNPTTPTPGNYDNSNSSDSYQL